MRAAAARKLDELESEVCDAMNMASLAVTHFEKLLTPSTYHPGEVSMFNWEADLAMFLVYQVRSKIADLHDKFFEMIEGPQT